MMQGEKYILHGDQYIHPDCIHTRAHIVHTHTHILETKVLEAVPFRNNVLGYFLFFSPLLYIIKNKNWLQFKKKSMFVLYLMPVM